MSEDKKTRIHFNELNNTILYGFTKDGDHIYIDDCENGLSCNLYCQYCHNRLIARNHCREKANHFAHESGSNCKKGHESTIVYLVERNLKEKKTLFIPNGNKNYVNNKIINIKEIQIIKDEDGYNNIPLLKIVTTDDSILYLTVYTDDHTKFAKKYLFNKYDNVLSLDLTSYRNSELDVLSTLDDELHETNFHKWWLLKEEYNNKPKPVIKQQPIIPKPQIVKKEPDPIKTGIYIDEETTAKAKKETFLYYICSNDGKKYYFYCPKDKNFIISKNFLYRPKCPDCPFNIKNIINGIDKSGCLGYLKDLTKESIMAADKSKVVVDTSHEDEMYKGIY